MTSTTIPDTSGLPLLIPVPRAAAMLGISRATAYRLAASGDLPSRRLGGRVYIVTAALLAMVEGAA
jgi:excisionase family DNA binding protein